MSHRTSITLTPEAYRFLESFGGENKSHFITCLLLEEKRRHLTKSILQANQEEGSPEYMELLAEWDDTLQDGLDA